MSTEQGKDSRHSLSSVSILPLAEFIHLYIDVVTSRESEVTVTYIRRGVGTGRAASLFLGEAAHLLEESVPPS